MCFITKEFWIHNKIWWIILNARSELLSFWTSFVLFLCHLGPLYTTPGWTPTRVSSASNFTFTRARAGWGLLRFRLTRVSSFSLGWKDWWLLCQWGKWRTKHAIIINLCLRYQPFYQCYLLVRSCMGKNAEPLKECRSNEPGSDGPVFTWRNWRNFNPSSRVNPSLKKGYPARGADPAWLPFSCKRL